MKKTTTFIIGIMLTIASFAQITPGQNHNDLLKAKDDKVTMSGNEALSHLMINPNPNTAASYHLKTASGTGEETLIGTTTYDLQSNAAVQNRIVVHNDGTISAGWTMSSAYNTTYADRGTGYNFFDGTSWGAQPTTRLEATRGGWPSIIALGNGGECAITHNTDNSYINKTSREYIGSGVWSEQFISSIDSSEIPRYLIWNRSATGGLDGNTIHMIAVTASSNFGGGLFNGLDGALVYYRSEDGGVNWDMQDIQLPGMDTSMYSGMGGDVYAIAAKDETVVVAYFDSWGDSYIVKSTDNGDTWTKTIFLDFPVDKYNIDDGLDLDSNGVFDQLYSSDNYGALILDDNNNAHIFYGIMMYLDDDLSDASSSWFPGINGIAYWNESFGPDTTPASMHPGDTNLWYSDMMNEHWIMAAPDLNADGIVGGVDTVGGYALYYASRASMPNAGLDANGNIWLSFSGYTETIDDGSQVYRHIYITKSEDGGITWKNPVDVTPNDVWNGMQECVFGSMNPVVDNKIRLIYQADFSPGLAVRGDEDMVDNNNIMYLEIDTVDLFNGTFTLNVGINEQEGTEYINIYPNPTKDIATLQITAIKAGQIEISITDILGKVIYRENRIINSGLNTAKINVSNIESGMYFMSMKKGNKTQSTNLIITK